tara:strand:+ start:31368 stop:31727 length:360 start_codon:yes stop_codon:yes gene_type:complete
MKKLFYFLSVLLIAGTYTSCSNDDDDNNTSGCAQSDWTGNYTGTCNDQPYSLIVTAEGGQRLSFELVLQNGSDTSVGTFEDCKYSFVLGGIMISATLDQDTIMYTDSTLECTTITFTRE